MRSNAYVQLANGEDATIIANSARKVATQLQDALHGCLVELMPLTALSDAQIGKTVIAELSGFCALTLYRASPEARQEFLDQCIVEFADLPVSLVCEALRSARRKLSYPERLVPYVFEQIGERVHRLEVEARNYRELLRLANAPDEG